VNVKTREKIEVVNTPHKQACFIQIRQIKMMLTLTEVMLMPFQRAVEIYLP